MGITNQTTPSNYETSFVIRIADMIWYYNEGGSLDLIIPLKYTGYANEWTMFTMTWNASGRWFYFNGVKNKTDTQAMQVGANSINFWIGSP